MYQGSQRFVHMAVRPGRRTGNLMQDVDQLGAKANGPDQNC